MNIHENKDTIISIYDHKTIVLCRSINFIPFLYSMTIRRLDLGDFVGTQP